MKRVRWKIDYISFKCCHCRVPFEEPQDLIKHKKKWHVEEIKRYPTVIQRPIKVGDIIPRHVKQLVLKTTKRKLSQVSESSSRNDLVPETVGSSTQVSPLLAQRELIKSPKQVSPHPFKQESVQSRSKNSPVHHKPTKKRAKMQVEISSPKAISKILNEEAEPDIAPSTENYNWYFRKRRLNCQQHPNSTPSRVNFACSLCNSHFADERSFDAHVNLHRTKDEEKSDFPCENCNKRFLTPFALKDHSKYYHGDESVVSRVTNTLPSKNEEDGRKMLRNSQTFILKKHYAAPTRGRQFQCEFCPIKYSTAGGLFYHQSRKHKDNRFACTQCDHSYTRECNLVAHFKSIHGRTSEANSSCTSPSKSISFTSGKSHRISRKNSSHIHKSSGENSNYAEFTTRSRCYLHEGKKRHFNEPLFRRLNLPSEISIPGEESLKTSNDEDFTSSASVIHSPFIDDSTRHKVPECPSMPRRKPIIFYCRICRLKFATAPTLLDHKKEKHPHLKTGLNLCSYCFTMNTNEGNHRSHMNKHEAAIKNNTDFPCTRCDKRFLWSVSLNMHLKHDHTETETQSKTKSKSKRQIPRAVGTFPGFFYLPISPDTNHLLNPQVIAKG